MSSQQPQPKATTKAQQCHGAISPGLYLSRLVLASLPSPPSVPWPVGAVATCPSQPNQRLRASRPAGAATRTAKLGEICRPVDRDEEPEAEQRGQLGRLRRGGEERAQQRRGVQAGEEGRGEEPEAAHEGPLPQALLPHPSRRHDARLPPLRRRVGGGVLQSRQQAGKGNSNLSPSIPRSPPLPTAVPSPSDLVGPSIRRSIGRKRNELTESESLHCIHGLPRQKF